MKLISLKLLNFRRFRQEEIIFRDDFSLIFWKNWAWKSSVIDGIWYALFWPSSKDFVRVNTSLLKSYFVTDRLPSKIELTFQFWMDEYRIVRVIDAWIKKFANDFIPETKDSLFWPNWLEIIWWWEVNDFIISLIWVSRDTFLRSVFAKQKDLEVLAWMAKDRKELINSILWLDKIEVIISQLKKEEKEKINFLNYTKDRLNQINLDDLKENKKEIDEELKIFSSVLKKKETELKTLTKTFEESKKLYESEDKKREEYNKLKSLISNLNIKHENEKKQIINLENTLNSIKDKEKILKEKEYIVKKEKEENTKLEEFKKQKNLFEQKKDLEKSIKENDIKLVEIEKNIKLFWDLDITKEIESQEKILKEIEIKISKISEEKVSKENKINYLREEYNAIKKEYDDIKNLSWEANCPTCLRPLEEHYPNLLKLYEEKILSKATDWKKEKEILEKVLKNLEKNKKSYEESEKKLKELRIKEKDFIKYLEQKTHILDILSVSKEKIKTFWEINYDEEKFFELLKTYEETKKQYLEYLKIEGEIRNKEKIIDDLEKSKSEEKDIIKSITEETKKLEKIEFLEEKYFEIKNKYFETNDILKEKQEEKNKQILEQNNLLHKQKEINLKIEEYKKSDESIKTLSNEISYTKSKITILWDYIIYLLEYLKPRIEDLASEYFSVITDGKYSYITLDNDYNILIDNKNIDLFSGWERDLANLCLRLSLWQNLSLNRWNPINFLVLDEVLWSQDKERQQNILINLKKLEAKFSQIILISHLEEIKDLATNLIEVKALNKEESKILYY